MKTLVLWLSLCLAFTGVRADEPTGIKFFTGSWKDVLAEAKRQNKPVFVDIYTTWCGPCKLMAKQAFPDAKVGEKFNANFVNYQIDAEKGEGIEVAKQYTVTAYPTSLYVAADGNLIHRAIGYGGIPGLLDEADKALEAAKDPMPLTKMEQEYKKGKRDPEFLYNYLKKRATFNTPDGDALDAYLKQIPESEWLSARNIGIVATNLTSTASPAYALLLKNRNKLLQADADKAGGTENFDVFIYAIPAILRRGFNKAVADRSESELEKNILDRLEYRKISMDYPFLANTITPAGNEYRLRFYKEIKNFDTYRRLAVQEAQPLMQVSADTLQAKDKRYYEMMKKASFQGVDPKEAEKMIASMTHAESDQIAQKLNGLAQTYYENLTDSNDLNQALTWSAKSLDYDRSPANLDTYAHLLSKLGRQAEAIKTQQEAISLQKTNGEDPAALEAELAKMKQK